MGRALRTRMRATTRCSSFGAGTPPSPAKAAVEARTPTAGTASSTRPLQLRQRQRPACPAARRRRPAGGPVAPRPPTRDELIAAARRPLPLPGVHTSPPPGFDQLVNLPTWLWVDNWAPVVGTASSPALTVTVTARPRNVYWRMGDGSADKVCGQGTPWNPALREEQQSSDCTHTYKRSSARQPGQRYLRRGQHDLGGHLDGDQRREREPRSRGAQPDLPDAGDRRPGRHHQFGRLRLRPADAYGGPP